MRLRCIRTVLEIIVIIEIIMNKYINIRITNIRRVRIKLATSIKLYLKTKIRFI
jgi:hypothetical protein